MVSKRSPLYNSYTPWFTDCAVVRDPLTCWHRFGENIERDTCTKVGLCVLF